MSTTIAISAAALASSSSAQLAASQARKSACEAFEMSYRPELATRDQKQQYAECVELLYPKPSTPMTDTEYLAVKGIIVILLVAVVFGTVKGWQEGSDTVDKIVWATLTGFMGAVFSGLIMLFGFLFFEGIAYLFS